jgi:DNA-binding NtrC family response regulator
MLSPPKLHDGLMTPAKILLITRDATLSEKVKSATNSVSGCELRIDTEQQCAVDWIQSSPVDVLLLHQVTEDDYADQLELLTWLTESGKSIASVVISSAVDLTKRFELMSRGVVECMEERLDCDRLPNLIEILTCRRRFPNGEDRAAPRREPSIARLPIDNCQSSFLFSMSGESAELMEQVRRVAPSMATVMLSGETGVGKTYLARLVHQLSSRRDQPFVTVNCGALSAGLIESELLGHVKGAFTGALRDHDGKMKSAGSGTLLLDEIDSLPMVAQASLLRAIDERVFEPVGSTKSCQFNARLIVATNRDLMTEVKERRFREDLYYRINVAPFFLSPLRERRVLISALAEKFLTEFSVRDGRLAPRLSEEAIQSLESFDWPGNIRQLRNVIERASSFCNSDTVTVGDLFPQLPSFCPLDRGISMTNGRQTDWIHQRQDAEVNAIRQALSRSNNNRAKAARELGMSRVTLYKKLHKYQLLGFN